MRKVWKWVGGGIIVFILVITALSYIVRSDILRDYLEKEANRNLKGYTVRIGSAYFHPFTFSLDLKDVILIQDAAPKPPVASVGGLSASVHWKELIHLRVVADIRIDHPKLYVNLKNVREEEKSKVPLKQKGWQEALFAIYPLKVNVLTIREGDITYIDEGPFPPLRVGHVRFTADNIRNIRHPEGAYPSPFRLEGILFEKGRLTMEGNANFLAEPHSTAKAQVKLVDVPLGPFKPITNRQNISVEKGLLSAEGSLEYGVKTTAVALKKLALTGVDVTYFHLAKTTVKEKTRIKEAGKTAKELSNKPTTQLSVDLVTIRNSTFGYLDKAANPNYRLFVDNAEMTVKNFSNQLSGEPATFRLTGSFMGSGKMNLSGSFVPETKTPNFNFKLAIEDTQMTTMSKLFQSYGKFDIQAGVFSLYSEAAIKGDRIQGYIKPLFRDMSVTDLRTSKEKSLFHKLYVAGVKLATKILKNRPRREVATQVDISGRLENPETSVMQIVGNLIKNAFFQAILPGFEREAKPAKGK